VGIGKDERDGVSLQPEIIVNNRNGLPGDFATPEQTIRPDQARLGILHDDERQLGLSARRRQLEIAKTVSAT
jgi:hypothetical protein